MNGDEFLKDAVREFRALKIKVERAVVQVSDDALCKVLVEDGNSVGVLMRHMAGNMRSRWTDFLTTDGEKESRNRDGEFELADGSSRQAIMKDWEDAWRITLGTLKSLTPTDLDRTIKIRGEGLSVSQAILRQLGHYSYHVGQIVQIARAFCFDEWRSLSIAPGKSEQFAQKPDSYLDSK